MRGNFERNMSYWRWYRSLTFKNVLGLAFLLELLGIFLIPITTVTCFDELFFLAYIGFSSWVVLYSSLILAIVDKAELSLKLLLAIPILIVSILYITFSLFALTIEVLPSLFEFKATIKI